MVQLALAPRQPEGRRCGPSPSQAMAPRIQQMNLSVTNTPLLCVTLQLTPRITQKPFSPNPCAHQCLCMKELCYRLGVCTPGALKAEALAPTPPKNRVKTRERRGAVPRNLPLAVPHPCCSARSMFLFPLDTRAPGNGGKIRVLQFMQWKKC